MLILTLFAAATIAAAPPEAPGSDTIDVKGRRAEEVREEAKTYVRSVRVAENERPVARWLDPVCPKALGVSEAVAAKVEARVRTIAREAGIEVAGARCAPNLNIAFADDGAAMAKFVTSRSSKQFVTLSGREILELGTSDAPLRWWHSVESRTSEGRRSMGGDLPGFAQDDNGMIGAAGQIYPQYSSSRISSKMVRALVNATVVIDVNRAKGNELDSVTDFAALVGLAEIKPSDPPPPNSILRLFDGGALQLTTLDAQFLTALYRLPLDRTAIAQRGLLLRGLVEGSTLRRPGR